MLDDDNSTPENTDESGSTTSPEQGEAAAPETKAPEAKAPAKKVAAKKTAAKKTTAKKSTPRKAPAKKAAAATEAPEETPAVDAEAGETPAKAPAKKAAAKKTAAKKTTAKKSTPRKSAVKKVAAPEQESLPLEESAVAADAAPDVAADPASSSTTEDATSAPAVLFQAPETTKPPARRTRKTAVKQVPAPEPMEAPEAPAEQAPTSEPAETAQATDKSADKNEDKPDKGTTKGKGKKSGGAKKKAEPSASADDEGKDAASEGSEKPAKAKKSGKKQDKADVDDESAAADQSAAQGGDGSSDSSDDSDDSDDNTDGDQSGGPRRRRRRGGRRRRKAGDSDSGADDGETEKDSNGNNANNDDPDDSDDSGDGAGGTRRRRRRRRAGDNNGGATDDPENTVTRVRQSRSAEDQITAVSGSTRLEAKKQRRREGREAGRRRAPIVSEAEFLARRESVDRVMVIRQREDLTQIAVLEDKVLVEHYVARESQTSLIGNVYVGRVQNVLPSMEAAFVDIGKGRNAVIYAGEINWASLGHKDGQPRKIESVLSSGQSILVQVTKDPIGHKGARLTGQVSLAGRFLVYVPDGTTSGISRKLPDTERSRLKALLKEIVPDTAGVIVRTAAEGASEDELTRDVERLKARWEVIEGKSKSGGAPQLLYGEPDLTLKVVRDLFTEDFAKLVIEGDDAWQTVKDYVSHVAPDLEDRLERFESPNGQDSFAAHRIDEQIAKGVDRKVWLPSGGSLIIDRTEAMTVVDVNTGKFTGSGGNLEETVTKNNLEAAEEIVRQLRLRDIGGIIVVDFIDMVLESNRDLVLRRLVECLGRDRTRHQVAEVTSLGLVQMTRKRIGTGLLEAFSEDCPHCQGRGLVVHDMPIEPKRTEDDRGRSSGGRRGRGRGKNEGDENTSNNGGNSKNNGGRQTPPAPPSPKDVAAVAKPENADRPPADSPEAEKQAVSAAAKPAPDDSPSTQPRAGEQPSSDETPAVVKTTRRRSNRRTPSNNDAGVGSSQEAPTGNGGEPVTPEPITPSEAQAGPKGAASTEAAPASPAGGSSEAKPVEGSGESSPKVVTRTRRVSRSAGVITPAAAEAITVASPTPAPVAATTEPVAAPKVTTTTRTRRGATRPAGASAAEGSSDGGDGADQGAGATAGELHVPVKKKGSRKR